MLKTSKVYLVSIHAFLDIGTGIMDYDIYFSYLCYVLAINIYCIH